MAPLWRLTKSESIILAKDKALAIAGEHDRMAPSPVERVLTREHVERLKNLISEGKALPFLWATVMYDGRVHRMNGQHSAKAIVELGATIPETLTFHLDFYEAESREGIIDLFSQFDQRWTVRTAADRAGVYQGLMPGIEKLDRKVMKLAAESLSWLLRTVEGVSAPSGDRVYDLLHVERYVPFFQWLNAINNGRKELLKKEVIAPMYKIYEAGESGATRFWRDVSFGPDYFTDDSAPGAVLIGELAKAIEDREFREKEFPTAMTYGQKCIKAWNAFCAGQRITSLKVSKGKGWPDVSRYGDQEEAA